MQTRTYGDLFKLASALIGTGGQLSDGEQDQLSHFINRRFSEIFNASPSWPRYVVVGESRTVIADQIIQTSESGLSNIGEFVRIHRTRPLLNRSALEYEFYVSALGAHILNQVSTTEGTAWATYKKEFTPFTVTSDYYNSTVEVPGEFFNFISHAVYADFLRVQNKQEEALAEEQAAQTFLALELEKIDIRSNNNTINHKFSTYVNRQSR